MTVLTETVARPCEQPATVRSQVTVPLRFPDGFTATAEVMTFHGLTDTEARYRKRYLDSPATSSAASAATAVPSCARLSRRLPPSEVSCCTSGRRGAASDCIRRLTRTPCRTLAWTPMKPTWR